MQTEEKIKTNTNTNNQLPINVYFGQTWVACHINWIEARKNSKFFAAFHDDENLPTHLLPSFPDKLFLTDNFRQVWALINGRGTTVPYDRYWVQYFQVDFFVLVRGFREDDNLASGYYHILKNPSPGRMDLLKRWWQLNQDGVMYSRNDEEEQEQPNDAIYEDMEIVLREVPPVDNLKGYDRFVLKINFLRTNY